MEKSQRRKSKDLRHLGMSTFLQHPVPTQRSDRLARKEQTCMTKAAPAPHSAGGQASLHPRGPTASVSAPGTWRGAEAAAGARSFHSPPVMMAAAQEAGGSGSRLAAHPLLPQEGGGKSVRAEVVIHTGGGCRPKQG